MKKSKKAFKVICFSTAILLSTMLIPKHINKGDIIKNIPTPTTSVDRLDIEVPSRTDFNASDDFETAAHKEEPKPIVEIVEPVEVIPLPEKKEIILSFIGDCTLGRDERYGYENSFDHVFKLNNNDYSYFFRNVKEVLEADDLTIANLEGTLTDATIRQEKKFTFKGDPSYVNILLSGSVEIVNLANNHTRDFKEKGYNDTLKALESSNIGYFGDTIFLIEEVKGIKIGFAGFSGFANTSSKIIQIEESLKYFNEQKVDIKIVSFHWGIERDNYHNSTQESLGKTAIDNGADLVIGHHPHVLQGIQEYNERYIVYSLGNFVFGGNRNPSDKDSMIFQKIFYFEDDQIVNTSINIIPVSISSMTNKNDFQPYVFEDENKVRVLNRINKYSKNFEYSLDK